ncbi:ferritin family protein [Thermodesulfobacteriota bacterium]
MEFKDLNEIISYAIEREKEAEEFYKTISQEEPMSGAKEMLEEFAEEEKIHQRVLKEFLNKGVVKSLDKYKLKWIVDIKRSDYVPDMEYTKGMGYNELLKLAMKREEKALALYNKLLDEAETEEGKKLFKILCQEEAKHKLKFETMYDDYMAEMGD